jgi:hypothetical protein
VITTEAEAVWSVDGVVQTDMQPAMRSSAYYLSDTEDGGRDIYGVSLDGGSNSRNLTANDDREYTYLQPLQAFDEHPLVSSAGYGRYHSPTFVIGYNELEGDREVSKLGLWRVSGDYGLGDHDLAANYDFLELTEGSDPDVVDTISLVQLEGLADAGLLQTCEMRVSVASANVYTEPHLKAPTVGSLAQGTAVQVNAVLRAANIYDTGWYHLSDGNWIKGFDIEAGDDCILMLPEISRASLNL